MARPEDLINEIADPLLRNQIAGEVGKLKVSQLSCRSSPSLSQPSWH